MRERGLKSLLISWLLNPIMSRSREGAWIEIGDDDSFAGGSPCRSREGAWIEMSWHLQS